MYVLITHDNRDDEPSVVLAETQSGMTGYLEEAYEDSLSSEDIDALFNGYPIWLGDVFLRLREAHKIES